MRLTEFSLGLVAREITLLQGLGRALRRSSFATSMARRRLPASEPQEPGSAIGVPIGIPVRPGDREPPKAGVK